MKIVYLLESAAHLWGGVKIALEGANFLASRGHEVTVLSRAGAPEWMQLECGFQTVPEFSRAHIPEADLIIGTDWSTVPAAVKSCRGIPVHFIQGYEGCLEQRRADWPQIDAAFRLDTHKVAISQHLADTVTARFGGHCQVIPNRVDHDVMFPASPPRAGRHPVRVGLVGPYLIDWKDIETGLEACRIAASAGLNLELVRISNSTPVAEERQQPFPVEWHVAVPPAQMGDLYRSMDVFLGTSSGIEEGFFLPAVEAMACGVPCVLTEIPCFRGYGEQQHALFVPPADPLEMAQALVVASSHDTLRDALREIGYQTASQYSATTHGEALERTLLTISAEARGTATTTQLTTVQIEKNLLQLSSGIAQALSAASDAFLSSGNYPNALKHMQAAVDIQPHDYDLQQQLGYARYLAGDDAGALEIYHRLIEQGHSNWAIHANMGVVLVGREDYAGAIAAFETAISTGGESAETVNNLGVAHYRAGDLVAARKCFERTLQLDAEHIEAAENLSNTPAKTTP